MEQSHEPISKLLASQGLNVDVPKLVGGRPSDQICGAVTSLVSRLPPFDFIERDGKRCLNVKSGGIVLARYTRNPQTSEQVAIIPTDEERLKIIVIPLSVVNAELSQSRSMQKVVREVLSNIEVLD